MRLAIQIPKTRQLKWSLCNEIHFTWNAVANSGFPVLGGVDLVGRGGVDTRGGYVSKMLYVETTESGALGGRAPGMPPRSANRMGIGKQMHISEILESMTNMWNISEWSKDTINLNYVMELWIKTRRNEYIKCTFDFFFFFFGKPYKIT